VRLYQTIAGLRSYLDPQRTTESIGLVPTMGALHRGHQRLIETAIAQNDLVVVSIFVNPLQFAPTEDLDQYPRQLETDCRLCEKLGVAAVFAPTTQEMGITQSHSQTTTVVPPESMMSPLCGQFREGHFEGVATVVVKLLNIVAPHTAYFGEKDGQQLAIIRRIVADLEIPVRIQSCPTVREADGLALSSRNQYLTPKQREQALVLSRSLQKAKAQFDQGEYRRQTLLNIIQQEFAQTPGVQLQYADLVDPHTLEPLDTIETAGMLALAAYVNATRLIDNLLLRRRRPIVAIDGPAGAGKSTVTRRVAQSLDLIYLDTGAMYRAITWLVLESGVALDDEAAVAELASQADIQLIPGDTPETVTRVQVNGEDVTQAIRTQRVTSQVSAVAAQPSVREALVKQQQRWGKKGGIVAEGRDIGTHVFPDAELKIFLTASVQERARRRWEELKNTEEVSLEELEADIQRRDTLDSTRKVSPLRKAPDAVEIVTDNLTIEEVTQKILEAYQALGSVVKE
jgi:pantoate ligase/cytidylate kinase